jgi:hypothetical protein
MRKVGGTLGGSDALKSFARPWHGGESGSLLAAGGDGQLGVDMRHTPAKPVFFAE